MDSRYPEHRGSVMRTLLAILVLMAATPLIMLLVLMRNGVSARADLSSFEDTMFHRLRNVAVSSVAEDRPNPLAGYPEAWKRAAHEFQEHCAPCHGELGRGDGNLGERMSPKASNLASPAVQARSDGELFYMIENGIRFSGMPSFADHLGPDDIWGFVSFIRHLPQMNRAELDAITTPPRGEHGHDEGEQDEH